MTEEEKKLLQDTNDIAIKRQTIKNRIDGHVESYGQVKKLFKKIWRVLNVATAIVFFPAPLGLLIAESAGAIDMGAAGSYICAASMGVGAGAIVSNIMTRNEAQISDCDNERELKDISESITELDKRDAELKVRLLNKITQEKKKNQSEEKENLEA